MTTAAMQKIIVITREDRVDIGRALDAACALLAREWLESQASEWEQHHAILSSLRGCVLAPEGAE